MITMYIYGLHSPDDETIMYIGKSKAVEIRRKSHVAGARRYLYGEKNKWISELLDRGLEPVSKVLEVCTEENVDEREEWWIKFFAEKNPSLTNVSYLKPIAPCHRFSDKKGFSTVSFSLENEYLQLMREIAKYKRMNMTTLLKLFIDQEAVRLGMNPIVPLPPKPVRNRFELKMKTG